MWLVGTCFPSFHWKPLPEWPNPRLWVCDWCHLQVESQPRSLGLGCGWRLPVRRSRWFPQHTFRSTGTALKVRYSQQNTLSAQSSFRLCVCVTGRFSLHFCIFRVVFFQPYSFFRQKHLQIYLTKRRAALGCDSWTKSKSVQFLLPLFWKSLLIAHLFHLHSDPDVSAMLLCACENKGGRLYFLVLLQTLRMQHWIELKNKKNPAIRKCVQKPTVVCVKGQQEGITVCVAVGFYTLMHSDEPVSVWLCGPEKQWCLHGKVIISVEQSGRSTFVFPFVQHV